MTSWRVSTYTSGEKSRKRPLSKCAAGLFPVCWQVYSFLDKMSFYNELYKHKPHDVVSHEDGTLWRRQTPKLLYPLGKMGPGTAASSLQPVWIPLCCFNVSHEVPLEQVLLLSTVLVDLLINYYSCFYIIRLFYFKNSACCWSSRRGAVVNESD